MAQKQAFRNKSMGGPEDERGRVDKQKAPENSALDKFGLTTPIIAAGIVISICVVCIVLFLLGAY